MPELSLIMPAFNEEATIEAAIEEALSADLDVDGRELVVVENGSQDRTREILRAGDWGDDVRVIELDANRGKGGAVRLALEAVNGRYVALLDADREYDAADLAAMLPPLREHGMDAVFGTRAWQAHSAYSFWYVMGNRAINQAANVLYNVWLSDCMVGLKVIPTDALPVARAARGWLRVRGRDRGPPAAPRRADLRGAGALRGALARGGQEAPRQGRGRDALDLPPLPLRLTVGTEACRACGSTRTTEAFTVETARYIRCRDCRSLFDADPPEPADLREIYTGAEYFVKAADDDAAGDTLWGYPADYVSDRGNVEAKFDRVLAHLARYVQPGRLLDVGCGPGFLLTAARARGWDGVGIDLNEWAVGYGRDELGLDLRLGELADAGFKDGEFDALTMMDLIEHVPDPDALIAEAARLVRPGGALAVLTPDAAARLSRAMGRRWPEVARPGEHTVLFSVEGLAALLSRHGFAATGWHSIGKTASLATLAADVAPAAPRAAARVRDWVSKRPLGDRVVEFDPRTKFCLYARRLPETDRRPAHTPARIPKRADKLVAVEDAILDELESLGRAEGFCDWMFDQFGAHVRGTVVEVGAGIGTFSQRLLDAGAERLVLIEPDDACADALERRFGSDARVSLAREFLPDSPALAGLAGQAQLVVCQNVLEHIGDDEAALQAMADALAEGGRLALVVPAEPGIYGPLDEAYGHWRRYEAEDLRAIVAATGLDVEEVKPLNALGIPGWWAKNRRPGARIGAGSLRTYEALLTGWRPLEERLRPARGLSLYCQARRE